MSEVIGRFHPVLVHLPIGILMLALLFETLSRQPRWQSLRPATPLVLLLGAVAAAFSCLTGWLLSQKGEYDSELVNLHQWCGVGVAVVSFSAYWLKRRPIAYRVASLLLVPGILFTGHWGMSLTHGEGYLTTSDAQKSGEPEGTPVFADIPDADVAPPPAEAIAALRQEGVVVLPVGLDLPFLSLNFVNAGSVTPATRKAMETLRSNIIWLKWSGMALNDSALSLIPTFPNLTRLSLDRTNISDNSIVYLQQSERLVYLNLVGTKVSAKGIETLAVLPNLRQLFLYHTDVIPDDTVELRTKLPHVQIDMGGYLVPVLPTDTTVLAPPK